MADQTSYGATFQVLAYKFKKHEQETIARMAKRSHHQSSTWSTTSPSNALASTSPTPSKQTTTIAHLVSPVSQSLGTDTPR